MMATAPTNGTTPWLKLLLAVVLGAATAVAAVYSTFTPATLHNRDIDRIELTLREMNGKLDKILLHQRTDKE